MKIKRLSPLYPSSQYFSTQKKILTRDFIYDRLYDPNQGYCIINLF